MLWKESIKLTEQSVRNISKKDVLLPILFLFFYTVALFTFCSKFSPVYNFNYWADINIYFTIGKGIWADKVLYKDLFDHKGPIIFFIYSLGYLFSHSSFLGMFFVQVLFQFIAVYFGYLSIRLFVRKNLALALSLLPPVFLMAFTLDGGSAEEFIYVCQSVSLYYLLAFFKKGEKEHPPQYMFIHGAMFTLVFFMKLNLVIFWFFPVLILFISLLYNKKYKSFFRNAISFLLGVFTILIPLLFYFYYNDALPDFWNAYIEFNFLYGKLNVSSVKDYILGLIVIGVRIVMSYYIILPLILSGLLFFVFTPTLKSKRDKLAVFLAAFSMFTVIVATRIFMPFYMIPFVVFSVFICIMLGILLEKINLKYKNWFLFFSFFICLSLGIFQKNFFGYSLSTLYNRDFPLNEVDIFASELEKETNPTLLIAGIKKGIPIYTKADILPNTKYFFFPNIHHEVYPLIRDTQTGYIQNKEVNFIILYENFRYHDYYKEIIEKGYEARMKYKDNVVGTVYLYGRR